MNINDIAYHLLVIGIGEIVKSNANTAEHKKAMFAFKLADTLRKFGMAEKEIDNTVKQTINLLS